jgi:hypothetical protein
MRASPASSPAPPDRPVRAAQLLAPQPVVTEPELERGVARLMGDAAFASMVGAVNSGVVLVAFALHLGPRTW